MFGAAGVGAVGGDPEAGLAAGAGRPRLVPLGGRHLGGRRLGGGRLRRAPPARVILAGEELLGSRVGVRAFFETRGLDIIRLGSHGVAFSSSPATSREKPIRTRALSKYLSTILRDGKFAI